MRPYLLAHEFWNPEIINQFNCITHLTPTGRMKDIPQHLCQCNCWRPESIRGSRWQVEPTREARSNFIFTILEAKQQKWWTFFCNRACDINFNKLMKKKNVWGSNEASSLWSVLLHQNLNCKVYYYLDFTSSIRLDISKWFTRVL